MTPYQRFVQHTRVRRLAVLLVIIMVLWLVRSLMSTILLTFIFTFLIVRLIRGVQRVIPRLRPLFVVIPVYLLLLAALYYAITRYAPMIGRQSIHLFNSVSDFYNSKAFDNNQIIQWGLKQLSSLNLKQQLQDSVTTLLSAISSIGGMIITFLLSLLLSFFYTIELDRLNEFGQKFVDSTFGWFFQDVSFFAKKFINTFGVVLEAQIVIAMVNTVITVVTLIFMKMPNIPSLGIMVFLLSLIPVAGAIISVVPLSIIAYTVGGWQDVVTIIVMIIIIHILESYVLNPKFMSSRTQLPIFFTFVVLLFAEHIWGTWGLIVGIPVFTFLLDILGVQRHAPKPRPVAKE
ncbi:AI-2E family transporter [Lacticaseibacillus pantheris]